MQAVVSLLDGVSTHRIKTLQQALKRNYGPKVSRLLPTPHFAWQLATEYDQEEARALLLDLAQDIFPLTIKTAGLGFFTGQQAGLYLPLVKDRVLLEVHTLIWHALEGAAELLNPYDHPDVWVPRIPLIQVPPDNLATVLKAPEFKNLSWDIEVNALALIRQSADEPINIICQVPSTAL